ncbi:MAG: hypothetical protein R3F40_07190 [Candidatus Competibacteraceae bacterium]
MSWLSFQPRPRRRSSFIGAGNLLGTLRTANQLSFNSQVKPASADPDHAAACWRSGQPPSWADDWGTDKYGHWVTFRVEGVTKMRWIAPGAFQMGSPENEPERYDDERPPTSGDDPTKATGCSTPPALRRCGKP